MATQNSQLSTGISMIPVQVFVNRVPITAFVDPRHLIWPWDLNTQTNGVIPEPQPDMGQGGSTTTTSSTNINALDVQEIAAEEDSGYTQTPAAVKNAGRTDVEVSTQPNDDNDGGANRSVYASNDKFQNLLKQFNDNLVPLFKIWDDQKVVFDKIKTGKTFKQYLFPGSGIPPFNQIKKFLPLWKELVDTQAPAFEFINKYRELLGEIQVLKPDFDSTAHILSGFHKDNALWAGMQDYEIMVYEHMEANYQRNIEKLEEIYNRYSAKPTTTTKAVAASPSKGKTYVEAVKKPKQVVIASTSIEVEESKKPTKTNVETHSVQVVSSAPQPTVSSSLIHINPLLTMPDLKKKWADMEGMCE
jgi:hypothetical protein